MLRRLFRPRTPHVNRLAALLLVGGSVACGGSEPPQAAGTTSAPNGGALSKPEGVASKGVETPATVPSPSMLYVGGRLQTAERPLRRGELVYAVTWEGMEPDKLKWVDMRTTEEGTFVLELPGFLRQLDQELELVLRPNKPANSPFKYLRADLPYPLPQGPVNLGALTIERREAQRGDAQDSNG
jgi:hypothetical protein